MKSGARTDKRVYFTQSPLRSDEHMAMVRRVVETVMASG